MKLEYIDKYRNDGIVKGVKCQANCGHVIKIGDWAMYERRSWTTPDPGYTALHVECIRAMIADVPTDASVQGQYNEIKGLVKTGSPEWL